MPEVVKEGVARDEDLRNSTELLEVKGKDEAIFIRGLELDWILWTLDLSSNSGDDQQPPFSPRIETFPIGQLYGPPLILIFQLASLLTWGHI